MKKSSNLFSIYFWNSFVFTPIFSLLFGIIAIYSYFYFGQIWILFLLLICLGFFLKESITLRSKLIAVLILGTVFFVLSMFSLPISQNKNQLLIDKTFCGLVTKNANNSATLNNFNLDNKFSLSSQRMTLSNEEVKSLNLRELEYVCINGNIKFFQSSFGNGFTIESPSMQSKYEYLADYRHILQQAFISPVDRELGEKGSLLKAIVLGVKDDLKEEDKDTFKSLGLMHLLVASGANIIIITNLISALFELLRSKFSIKPSLIRLLKIFVTLSYLLLVGLEGSLTRAFFFFIVLLLTELVQRNIPFLQKIMLTSVILLLLFPGLFFSYSFYLSIFAVFAIQFSQVLSNILDLESDLSKNLLMTLVVPIFMFMPTSFFFGEITLISLVSNLIIAPAVEVFVGIGFIYILICVVLSNLQLQIFLNFISTLVGYVIDAINLLNQLGLSCLQPLFSLQNYRINFTQFIFLIISLFILYFFFFFRNFVKSREAISL